LGRQRHKQLRQLERRLGVRFRRLTLLDQALTHRSYRQAQGIQVSGPKADNETLEFLGDAVLGLVIAEELFRLHPSAQVGELAKIKAQVVSRSTLADIAMDLQLGNWLLMGPGEQARGEEWRPSVVGSALEAVLGALFLDRGLAVVRRFIRQHFQEVIAAIETGATTTDYKSLLQEYVLRYFRTTPDYRIVGESGPGHRRRFHVEVGWNGKVYGEGSGSSKKAASQEAARAALEHVLAPLSPKDS
jgi:ribonuclease-3